MMDAVDITVEDVPGQPDLLTPDAIRRNPHLLLHRMCPDEHESFHN